MSKSTYHQLISAIGKEAIRKKRANGEQMHKAPLGFKNARDADGRSVLVGDPDTLPLVLEARLMRRRGLTIRAICRVMYSKGLRSRRGKRIGPSSMLILLKG